MSIKKENMGLTTAEQDSEQDQQEKIPIVNAQRQKRWQMARQALLSPLWLCLLAAVAIRVWLIVHTNGVIDGDEALVGIQAEHILRGEFPAYFYGQAYMGSLEAYLIAIIFAIAGPSVWALRAEPILLSLVVVWLTWRLAGVLADTAKLPQQPRLLFQTFAAFFAALSPLYDAVLELRTLGGYIETFVLMLLLLLSALQLTRRWKANASQKELALRWAGIGFVVGLGFWVDPLIISAVLAAASWILLFFARELLALQQRAVDERVVLLQDLVAKLFLVWAAIPAFFIGLLPALIWGYNNQWANLKYIVQSGKLPANLLNDPNVPKHHLALIAAVINLYRGYIAPHIIGGSLPIESATLDRICSILFVIGLIVIGATLVCVLLSLLWPQSYLVRIRQLTALPLIFGLWTAIIFCVSSESAEGLLSVQVDYVGRYAGPLFLALPFFYAALITIISMLLSQWGKNLSARAVYANEGTLKAQSTSRDRIAAHRVPIMAQVLLFACAALCLLATAYSYGLADPGYTFQTPACKISPANDEPIIAYLEQQHVHYAWALTWIGNPIIFKTQERIIVADPRVFLGFDAERIAAYTNDVVHAQSPALLFFVSANDSHPPLLRYFDAHHITYQAKLFPSEPGTDIMVVTALSRTIMPGQAPLAYHTAFPNCPI
jgi:hypothetical protein